jgi:hypothetical protein
VVEVLHMGRRGEPLLTAACWLLGAAAAAAQTPAFPKAGSDPVGVVVDEQGKKIAGATVRLRFHAAQSAPWQHATLSVLRHTPLPAAVSDRDGEFVLPLARDQRRLGTAGDGVFSLCVDKDGYVPWTEPLPQGIGGYLGSRVVLRRPLECERIRVHVAAPEPGMIVVVQAKHWPQSLRGVAAPVGRDGMASVIAPLVPSPPILVQNPNWAALSLEVSLAWPGRSTRPQPVLLERLNEVPDVAGRTLDSCKVTRRDGRTPEGVRGLYRCVDGESRWFPVRGAEARSDEHLRLEAVTADGCGVAAAASEVVLEPGTGSKVAAPGPNLPVVEKVGSLRVHVVDERNVPIAGVSLRLSDELGTRDVFQGPPLATDEHGLCEIPGVAHGKLRQALLAVDDVHLPKIVDVEVGEGGRDTVEITLADAVERRLATLTASGAAAPFVSLWDVERAQRGLASPDGRPRYECTDSLGRIVLRRRPDEAFAIQSRWNPSVRWTERSTGDAAEDVGTLVLESAEPVLILVERGTDVRRMEWGVGGRANSNSIGSFGTASADAFLVRPLGANEHVTLGIIDAPPIVVRGTDAGERAVRSGGVVVCDRRKIVRTIPLRIEGADPKELLGLTVSPSSALHGGAMFGRTLGNFVTRGADGTPSLALRDLDGADCVVFHRGFLRTELSIPARAAAAEAEVPLTLKLARGTAVRLRLTPETKPGPGLTGTFILNELAPEADAVHAAAGRMIWYGIEPLPGAPPAEGAGPALLVDLPFALAPGRYSIQVNAAGKSAQREFVVREAREPVIVDLDR